VKCSADKQVKTVGVKLLDDMREIFEPKQQKEGYRQYYYGNKPSFYRYFFLH
jgi:hypothetical protein